MDVSRKSHQYTYLVVVLPLRQEQQRKSTTNRRKMVQPEIHIPDRSFISGQWYTRSSTETIPLLSAYDDSVVVPGITFPITNS